MITIFTPTYNRAHTLPRLYKSLVAQNRPDFFEWLIVDDGSTDSTKELINTFIKENIISIRYYKQENKGKHFAVNKGVAIAQGDFFVNIDSDDYLLPDAVEEMYSTIEELGSDSGGFTFIHFTEDVNYDPAKYGKKRIYKPQTYQWEHPGEMMYCLKTEVYRRFPFPEFEGEKFCPESLVLRRIEKAHRILYTDRVLAGGNYLEGGLSSNFYTLIFHSPHGSLLNFKERIREEKSFGQKLEIADTYFDIAWKSSNTTFKEKYFNLPLSLILSVVWLKIKRRV